MLFQAIGLGLVVSLFFTEILGLAAGGLVVPGYIALYLDQPLRIGAHRARGAGDLRRRSSCWAASMLLYGRRTMVFCVLAGFLFGYLTRYLLVFNEACTLGVDAARAAVDRLHHPRSHGLLDAAAGHRRDALHHVHRRVHRAGRSGRRTRRQAH